MADNGYGLRQDGTPKGKGWLGELKRPDGGVSTELSIGLKFGNKEMDVPSLVPTLNKDEIDYLLNINKPSTDIWRTPIGKTIMMKAYDHAAQRLLIGKSPFAD